MGHTRAALALRCRHVGVPGETGHGWIAKQNEQHQNACELAKNTHLTPVSTHIVQVFDKQFAVTSVTGCCEPLSGHPGCAWEWLNRIFSGTECGHYKVVSNSEVIAQVRSQRLGFNLYRLAHDHYCRILLKTCPSWSVLKL